jgi:hypothetical protein
MSLEQAIRIQELICKEKEANHYYEKEKRLGTSSVRFDKDVCCGLYDAWNGAGGLFEIRLWKDIELPIKYIQSIPMHTSIVIRVGNTKQQTKVLRKASSVTLSLCFALDKIKAITIPTKAINCVCQQLCSIGTADMDVQ